MPDGKDHHADSGTRSGTQSFSDSGSSGSGPPTSIAAQRLSVGDRWRRASHGSLPGLTSSTKGGTDDPKAVADLHKAAEDNDVYRISECITPWAGRGLSVNAKDPLGRTPLHTAAAAGNLVAAKLLITRGARTAPPLPSQLPPRPFSHALQHDVRARRASHDRPRHPQARRST